MMQNKIKLFENCLVVNGASRSCILDMQRQNYYLVPNTLAALFDENHIFQTSTIETNEESREILEEYVKFLIDNELCFYCEEELIESFPVIDFNEWDYPAHITNALIELDFSNPVPGISILKECADNLLTRHFEIQATGVKELNAAEEALKMIDDLDLYSYNLVIAFKHKDLEDGIKLIQQHYKIFRAIVHSSGKNDIIISDKGGWGNIFLISEPYSHNQCGVVDPNYFANNIEHITESHQHNTCLNRKLAIDKEGNIKNCLGMCGSHGNIKHDKIQDVIKNKDFQKLWYIKKDEITKCKDCEFRHICTDCRAFVDDPKDIYSAPLKCGYDPYTNQWEEWSTLPFKQNAIEFYSLKQ